MPEAGLNNIWSIEIKGTEGGTSRGTNLVV